MTLWRARLLELAWLVALVAAIVTAFERLPFWLAYAICVGLIVLTDAIVWRRGR